MKRWLVLLLMLVIVPFALAQDVLLEPSDRIKATLNVRSEPRADAPVVATLAVGERAAKIGDVPYWYKVKLSTGIEGWAPKAYMKVVATAPAPEPAPTTDPALIAERDALKEKVSLLEATLAERTDERDALAVRVAQLEARLSARIATEALTLAAGESTMFMWVNTEQTPTPRDWMGLYAVSAPDVASRDGLMWWAYGNCTKTPDETARTEGACVLDIPEALTPGTYELRLFANDGFTKLATSGPITVTPKPELSKVTVQITGDPASGQPYAVEAIVDSSLEEQNVRVEFYVNGVLERKESSYRYCWFTELADRCGPSRRGSGAYTLVAKVFQQDQTTGAPLAEMSVDILESVDVSMPTPQPAPPATSLIVPRIISGNIAMDGVLTEQAWLMAPSVLLTSPRSDNKAIVRALWNATHLYLAYDVTDAHVEGVGTGCICTDDGMEFYLDVGRKQLATMAASDFHVLADITGRLKVLSANTADVSGGVVKTATRPGGYTMEFSIPWSALGVTAPATGMTLGALLCHNDRDNNGATRVQYDWLHRSERGEAWAVPKGWGTLVLGN